MQLREGPTDTRGSLLWFHTKCLRRVFQALQSILSVSLAGKVFRQISKPLLTFGRAPWTADRPVVRTTQHRDTGTHIYVSDRIRTQVSMIQRPRSPA